MRARSLLLLLFLPLVFGSFSCGGESPTEVVVVIDAQTGIRSIATHVLVRITSGDSSSAVPTSVAAEQTIGTSVSPVPFPLRVGIVPQNGDASRRYLVEVTALDENDLPRARVRAISTFVHGRILELRLMLEDGCLDVLSCTDAATCHAGSCAAADVDATTLPTYEGPPASYVQEHYIKGPPKRGSMNSVAISGDTVAIGLADYAVGDAWGAGAVAIYLRSPTTGDLVFDQIVLPPDPAIASACGWPIDLEDDVLVVGCPNDSTAGSGVISTYAQGAPTATGTVFVYRRDTNGIFQLEAGLKSPHPRAMTNNDQPFASALAISGDVIVIGDSQDDSAFELGSQPGDPWDPATLAMNSGSAFVYRRVGGTWTFERHLKHHDVPGMPGYGGQFGYAVAIEPDIIAIGAPYDEYGDRRIRNGAPFTTGSPNASSGSVSTFGYAAGAWTRQAFIQGSQVQSEDRFGSRVALDLGTLVVIAPNDRSPARGVNPTVVPLVAERSSAAYVFVIDGGGDWRELAWIKHPADLSESFGDIQVAIDYDHFVVGVPYEDGTTRGVGGTSNAIPARNADRGAVFVYRRAGGTWLFDSYLKASNGDDGDFFGGRVAIDDNHIVVLAPNEDGGGTTVDDFSNPSGGSNTGAGYLFVPTP